MRAASARSLAAVALGVALLAPNAPGSARPVTFGRHTEVPHGIPVDHPWVTHAGDPGRRRRARHPGPRRAPERLWETRVGVGAASAPAMKKGGPLYVATSTGVTAMDPDGSTLWSTRVRFVLGTPSITPEGNLLVATRNGSIIRLDAAGEIVGRATADAGIAGPPLVLADGSVVVSTRDGAVARYDAEGRRLFRRPLPEVASRPLAWDGRGRVVVPSGNQLLFLSADGRVEVRATVEEPIVSGPAVADDGTVWVLGNGGTLWAFDRDARLRARASVGKVAASSPVAVGPDGAVRVGTREGGLVSIGPTGTERWRLDTEGVFLGGLSVDPRGVTFGITVRGALVAVGPDGKVSWRAGTRPRTSSDPVVSGDGTLFVGTSAGTVQAFR